MKSNSFAHGNSESGLASAYNGNGLACSAALTITGVTLGGKKYAAYPEMA